MRHLAKQELQEEIEDLDLIHLSDLEETHYKNIALLREAQSFFASELEAEE